MLEVKTEYRNKIMTFCLIGRIDGITSPDLEKAIEKLVADGNREIFINLSEVSYISSVGLRVFLAYQKILKKISGEIILFSLPESVFQVFSISGFTNVFKIFKDFQEIEKVYGGEVSENQKINSGEYNGFVFEYLSQVEQSGSTKASSLNNDTTDGDSLQSFGSYEKLSKSEYDVGDIVEVDAKSVRFALGLGAIGNSGEDLEEYFGEMLVINNNIFVFPARKSSKVDFILELEQEPNQKISFLNGFATNKNIKTTFVLKEQENLFTLNNIAEIAGSLTKANLYGIVFLGVSGGVLGMNLKKVPLVKNKVVAEIFDKSNFPEWFDYPVDMQFISNSDQSGFKHGLNIMGGFGIAVKDKSKLGKDIAAHFSQNSNIHFHSAIFEKEYLSHDIFEFEKEIKRVTNELNVIKVQHIMGNSVFKSGYFGIIELGL